MVHKLFIYFFTGLILFHNLAWSSDSYYWWDGKKKREIHLKEEKNSNQLILKKIGNRKKINSDQNLESPILVDGSGEKKLAGGILCYFKTKHKIEEFESWSNENSVVLKQLVSSKTILIEAPKNLTTLELANKLSENKDVRYCQPNWEHSYNSRH